MVHGPLSRRNAYWPSLFVVFEPPLGHLASICMLETGSFGSPATVTVPETRYLSLTPHASA
jgi:hypothetical protein